MKRVLLDPGHGGRDPGAVGPTGLREKDVVLLVAQLLQTRLGAVSALPMQVRLTRTTDVLVGLRARALIANAWPADAFISLHCNAAANPQAHGFEVFTTPGQNRSDLLAQHLIDAVRVQLPELRLRVDRTDRDDDKEATFTVLAASRVPTALVEMAFISNPQEEGWLRQQAFLDRMVGALATGVQAFLGGGG